MCHRASDARAWQCDCGYEFGQSVDKVLELLRGQRKSAAATLAFVVFLDVAMVGAVIYSTSGTKGSVGPCPANVALSLGCYGAGRM